MQTKNCSVFKSIFSSLAQNLVSKLPPLSNTFTESKVASLKDGTDVLSGPISQLWNLPVKLNYFLRSCKIGKVEPLFKKIFKTDPQKLPPYFTSPPVIKN